MKRRRKNESGFAMLLVFLMAAVVAISLYLEVPRVAMQAQRQKEQLLIERGEQYKRAIQVFVDVNHRWPAKIEDLENFNTRRYLRKRYLDPMTGKEEWRLIHIANGVLQDSKTQKQNKDEKDKLAGQYVGEVAGVGQTGSTTTTGAASALRRRSSDGLTPGVGEAQGDPNAPADPNQNPGAPGQLAQSPQPGLPGQPVPGQPGQLQQGQPVAGQTGLPPGVPGVPGQAQPGQIAPGQIPGQSMTPGQIIQGRLNPTQPGAAGGQPQAPSGGGYVGGGAYIGSGGVQTAPGAAGQQPTNPLAQSGSNPALDAINKSLTGPRTSLGPNQANQGVALVQGNGIAGFASTADAEGVMVYDDHTNYSEWEFIYDPTKKKPPFNPLQGGIGTPADKVGTKAGSANK